MTLGKGEVMTVLSSYLLGSEYAKLGEVMERPVFWGTLLKLANRYRCEAEQCLASESYFAGLVSVRAALEAVLIARYLLELFDWSEEELSEYGLRIDETKNLIGNVSLPILKELIEQAYTDGLIRKSGRKAAHRIREWGNKIHPERVVIQSTLPRVGRKNLEARLKDLDMAIDQLMRTL